MMLDIVALSFFKPTLKGKREVPLAFLSEKKEKTWARMRIV